MSRNPHEQAKRQRGIAVTQSEFTVGLVESVDDEEHLAEVRLSPSESIQCEVAVDSTGDYTLPPRETQVIVARRKGDRPVIIRQTYQEAESIPQASGEDGERVIGHPASDTKIRFNADGSYEILRDDGSTAITVSASGVTLGDGTTKPIARKGDAVEVTDTNGNTLTGSITEGSANNESN